MSDNEKKTASKVAVRFADYSDIVEANLGSLRGPNTIGEYMAVVEVNHNFQDQTTRVGFAFAGRGNPNAYLDRFIASQRVLSEAVRNNTGSK